MHHALQNKLLNPGQGVYLIGTTPPKSSTSDEQMVEIAEKLLARLTEVDYDGIVVYDIQDESTRIDTPRPFPFTRTRDPREYSALLTERNHKETVTYKSVAQPDTTSFDAWVMETTGPFAQKNLVLVGSPSSAGEVRLTLNEAYDQLANTHSGVALGGVTIAERHAKKGDEHLRLLNKQRQGCRYFISQAVYNPQATIDLLSAYARACRDKEIEPARVILTFTPCGSEKTLEFMKWLGISVPEATQYRILDAQNPLRESIKLCYQNLDQILSAVEHLGIPLGLNIESLTNRREEIDAAIQLYRLLKARMELSLARHQLGL